MDLTFTPQELAFQQDVRQFLAANLPPHIVEATANNSSVFVEKDIALQWRESFSKVPRLRLLECTKTDLAKSWEYFERRDLHKLSAVDATSFAVMKRENIKTAFTFDAHFAAVGFKVVG